MDNPYRCPQCRPDATNAWPARRWIMIGAAMGAVPFCALGIAAVQIGGAPELADNIEFYRPPDWRDFAIVAAATASCGGFVGGLASGLLWLLRDAWRSGEVG